MNMSYRLLLVATLALPFVTGCEKEAEEVAVVAQAPLVAPTTNDEEAWNAYLTEAVKRNLDGAFNTYVYTLPAADSPDFQGAYDRQLEKAQIDVQRGGVEGTLLAFGSPDSAKSADLAVASFEKAAPDAMKGVKVLFIGKPEDRARVEQAVARSGATFQFVEVK